MINHVNLFAVPNGRSGSERKKDGSINPVGVEAEQDRAFEVE